MRRDSVGLFWEDVPKTQEKRTPPEPVWLLPDYLPGLEQARAFPVHLMTDEELVQAQRNGERLIFDIETYSNYFLCAFTSLQTGWVTYVECGLVWGEDESLEQSDIQRLGWILLNFTLVSFNGNNFDIPIASMALAGKTCQEIKAAANMLIVDEARPHDVLKKFKVKRLANIDHIDLLEVAPLQASLKIYGGRLHAPKMQDLPFHPDSVLSEPQIAIVRWYCVNDLTNTAFLHEKLKEQLQLREAMSREYGVDLRSKSDAQLAEAVISTELERLSGEKCHRNAVPPGTPYQYQVPEFVSYESDLMQWVLGVVRDATFLVPELGKKQELPAEIGSLKVNIAKATYTMGVGGLHSTEKRVSYVSDDEYVLIDRDVASYYPQIILNLKLFPAQLGPNFLAIYQSIVTRRLAAKKAGQKIIAESLKITVNGSFGKLGSPYSVLYSPHLMTQVTVTGQLCLLMLIEQIELAGIQVISGNTDGVVIRCPRTRIDDLNSIIAAWEAATGFATEETRYLGYYSRDVNNYIAVKADYDKESKQWLETPPKSAATKTKGEYAATGLQKNPTNYICVEAAEQMLVNRTPIADTIRGCTDVRKFVSVRKVNGGAVQDGNYLGQSIRTYYATGTRGEMVYATNGNKVPRSDGAKPLMELPDALPDDIDYAWYEAEATSMLQDVGFYPKN